MDEFVFIPMKYLSKPWFTHVKTGVKTIEGRLNNPAGFWSHLQIGDRVTFSMKKLAYVE